MLDEQIQSVILVASGAAIAGHLLEYRSELRQRMDELVWSWREYQMEREFEGGFTMDKDVCMLAILAVVLMVMGLHAPLPVTMFSGLLVAALIWLPRRRA